MRTNTCCRPRARPPAPSRATVSLVCTSRVRKCRRSVHAEVIRKRVETVFFNYLTFMEPRGAHMVSIHQPHSSLYQYLQCDHRAADSAVCCTPPLPGSAAQVSKRQCTCCCCCCWLFMPRTDRDVSSVPDVLSTFECLERGRCGMLMYQAPAAFSSFALSASPSSSF